ncbi:hypothetical protein G4G27_04370 [Sphingomonas sp. So64.6b]|uniref:hypothetical protein n=1 Tax=Sphingomonas sp. So64.6b TaxID=2997354 RepID=UPI0016049B31|nr:hypothetical protein [Sphingomonas sp. So64.6b]QNA83325.1 hypothetical protein G4G27_04370 [Sphingomonas sp. So64.6b]
MSLLQTTKLWLVNHLHLAKDALHIYVALGLFFGSALLFGWRLRSWKPWLVVAVAAVLGEIWDIRDRYTDGIAQNFGANFHDLWNTIFWPSVILILARRTTLFQGSGRTR